MAKQSDMGYIPLRRVLGMTFDYAQLFPEPIFKFLKAKAKSIRSSISYLCPSIVMAIAFLLANSDAHFRTGSHIQPFSLYSMSVGHPGSGKSPDI